MCRLHLQMLLISNAAHLSKCGMVDGVGNRHKAPYADLIKRERRESKQHQRYCNGRKILFSRLILRIPSYEWELGK